MRISARFSCRGASAGLPCHANRDAITATWSCNIDPGEPPGHVGRVNQPEALALYIHWPFCLAKCPYCDFNSHVRERIPQTRFAAALRRELAFEAARLGPRPLASIFFGGGTPSLMAPETVAVLIEDARGYFDALPNIEITLEANPTSVELGKLESFRHAGINRLSLGVQALDDSALRFLGRQHSATQALAALEFARATFPRLSFDLIYARPGQTLPAWQVELHRALSLAADHLSLYQLTIEPGTAFEALHRNGTLVLPDEDTATALYDATAEAASEAGLLAYEISNYAAPGAESRHNLAYWRYNDYAGIGPGAHGRISLGGALWTTRRHRAPEPWAERVECLGHGTTAEEPVPPRDRAREALLMGLRLAEGIELHRFETRTGIPMRDAVDANILDAAQEAGYLTLSATHLTATADGRRRLDALLARLVQ
jgi:oxygen-independent coproporphyrinogen-3 oxidase